MHTNQLPGKQSIAAEEFSKVICKSVSYLFNLLITHVDAESKVVHPKDNAAQTKNCRCNPIEMYTYCTNRAANCQK